MMNTTGSTPERSGTQLLPSAGKPKKKGIGLGLALAAKMKRKPSKGLYAEHPAGVLPPTRR